MMGGSRRAWWQENKRGKHVALTGLLKPYATIDPATPWGRAELAGGIGPPRCRVFGFSLILLLAANPRSSICSLVSSQPQNASPPSLLHM